MALPTISRYFGISVSHVSKVMILFLASTAVFSLPFGRLGDIKSYRKVLLAGLLIFMAGTFLCGISNNINMLLFFRMLEGMGSAMILAVNFAVVPIFLPAENRGKFFGIIIAAFGLAYALGPAASGFITQYIGWHSIFFLNVPIALATFFIILKYLPEEQPEPADKRFDMPGTVLICLSIVSFIYSLEIAKHSGTILYLLITAVFIIALIIWEKKISYPIIDLTMFRNYHFTNSVIAILMYMLVITGVFFIFPFYLEETKNLSVYVSGLIMLVPAAISIILEPIAGAASDRIGCRMICSMGALLLSLALTFFIFLKHETNFTYIIFSLLLLGIGMGIFPSP
ncbi:MAG: MFS transporter, partial [Armatimonadota bacterium]